MNLRAKRDMDRESAGQRTRSLTDLLSGVLTPMGTPTHAHWRYMPETAVQPVLSTSWTNLVNHLNQWFFKPDFEALRIIYSAVASHWLTTNDPVWPLVIAPPSSGKTSIAVGPLICLEGAHLIGDVTPKTFLSGKKGVQSSLLHRIGSGFMIMKDFGTFLQKRDNDKNEVLSQLREIYDGEFGRQGGDGKTQAWSGKITIVAAATLAVDRSWTFQHDLGERFTNIRWLSIYNRDAGRFACRQIDNGKDVKDETRRLIRVFFDSRPRTLPPALSDSQQEQIIDLALFVARMRATVVRDSNGKREIIEVGAPEGITRLHKTFSTIARFHAQLYGCPTCVGEADMRIVQRVAIDAIRPSRWDFIHAIPFDGDINKGDLQKATNLPSSTVGWIGDELEALGLIEHYNEAESGYTLSTVLRSILGATNLHKYTPLDLGAIR